MLNVVETFYEDFSYYETYQTQTMISLATNKKSLIDSKYENMVVKGTLIPSLKSLSLPIDKKN